MAESTICSSGYRSETFDETFIEEDDEVRLIIVGSKCKNNTDLEAALKKYDLPMAYSFTGLEFINDDTFYNIFVLDNFEGDIFAQLRAAHKKIVGTPVLIEVAANCTDLHPEERLDLPRIRHPWYCSKLSGFIICFTGVGASAKLAKMVSLVHFMGGEIRKEMMPNVDILVANIGRGQKYRRAVSMDKPILTLDWLLVSWEHRDDKDFDPTSDHVMLNFKVQPFSFCCMSFLGFTKEEERHMEQQCVEYGGVFVEIGSASCTHLVVDEKQIKVVNLEEYPEDVYVVTSEWFWSSIQIEVCADEKNYQFEEMNVQIPVTPCSPALGVSYGGSASKSRKRKRVKENIAQLALGGDLMETPTGAVGPARAKRISDEMNGVLSGSSMANTTTDSVFTDADCKHDSASTSLSQKDGKKELKLSARQQTILELYNTEKNYLGILHTILKIFKEEIEKPNQRGVPILDSTDVKIIFGKIPALYELHVQIRDCLAAIVTNFDKGDTCCVGEVFNSLADALKNSYPPFINFFESTKEAIEHCDKTKPRFHAFLKICQNKPECGRQTLKELMIRPVQRLPSVILLLKDILKRTESSHADHEALKEAILAIEGVMTHINEQKGKTEGHQAMFDIVNDIENCPPYILSSMRSYEGKVDVVEVTHELLGRGEHISIFLFNDLMEITKRRVKILNAKSPSSYGTKTPQKAYKHLAEVHYTSILRVVNFQEKADCKNAFGFITGKHKLYSFMLIEEEVNKDNFILQLCRSICNNTCRADLDTFLATVDGANLNIDTADLGSKTLGKAAARFGRRVTRVLSLRQTPRLKRAISSMTQISPFGGNRSRDSTMFSPGDRVASVCDLTQGQGWDMSAELQRHLSIRSCANPCDHQPSDIDENSPDIRTRRLPRYDTVSMMSINSDCPSIVSSNRGSLMGSDSGSVTSVAMTPLRPKKFATVSAATGKKYL